MTQADHPISKTLLAAVVRTVSERRLEPALRWRAGAGYSTMNWQEYLDRSLAAAAGLRRLGVDRGDRVLLLSGNRPEFHVMDLACMLLGAIPISVYNSPSIPALAHVVDHSAATTFLVENRTFHERVLAAAETLGLQPTVIGLDTGDDSGAIPFEALTGSARLDLDEAVRAVGPDDVATVIYTSGTSGRPKGVPLRHRNLVFSATALARRIAEPLSGMRQVSYLPMAHIGERLATHYLHLAAGTLVTCCPTLAELDDVIADIRPQFLFGAPRLWERLRDAVIAEAGGAGGDAVSQVLARRGLADLSVAITGSAPMPPHVHRFWLDQGVPLADCYGQTESGGVGTWDPHDIAIGTCGKAFDGVEVKVLEDGEIAVRGPAVFSGYLHDPDKTAEVLDADGWYRTGDLGRLDTAGNLSVVGRKNEMLVPTSGHNVSPIGIESSLRQLPCVAHAVVVGHGRPYLTALLTVDAAACEQWAAERGLAADPLPPELRAEIEAGVKTINDRLPGAERIRAYRLITEMWDMGSDVLTASGKLRRRGVTERYAEVIDEMYGPGR
ncbi:AMP-dependent synthetase/ligase [Actinomadura physcomitrii]|nr:AMP-dependent synthetase/ligase [Actinomadura physcomitrii]